MNTNTLEPPLQWPTWWIKSYTEKAWAGLLVWPQEVALISTLLGKMLTVHSVYKFTWRFVPTTDGYLPMNSSNQNPVHFTSLPPFPYPGAITELIQTIIFLTLEEEKELPEAPYSISKTKHEWVGCALGLSDSLVAQRMKHLPAMQETRVLSLGWEDPLEKEMATHSSILAWRIPWTEEPGRLQSTGSQSRTRLSDFTHSLSKYTDIWEGCCTVTIGMAPIIVLVFP